MFLGIEVKAERLLEELDNGVLLCQLIDVLQNMVKTCNSEEPGVGRYLTSNFYTLVHPIYLCMFLPISTRCKLPPQLSIRP